MAQVTQGNQIRLNSGQTIQAQEGGWYDGQQFFGGTLSQPGQINTQSNQQGAGQAVSQEVIAQTNPANVAYIEAQRKQAGLEPAPPPAMPTTTPSGAKSTPSTTTSGTGIDTAGAFNQPTINLPQLYEQLYASSGIRDIESGLSAKTNAYNEQVAKIKDNPYLSEATMTGRLSKLSDKFNADTANIRSDIAMRKADLETKLNLQTKQFDINSQQAKLAWEQFNSLLSSGALDNASGDDIAQITRATGISSSMIQSAIGVSKKKNAPQVSVSQFDDGTNVYAVAIDENGNVVNKQIIGASEPSKTGGATKTETKAQEKKQNTANLTESVKDKVSLKALIEYYSSVLSIDDIYRIYNLYSPFGRAKETLAQVKQGIFASEKGGLPKKK